MKTDTVKLHFEELGITCNVDISKLQQARSKDRRGYATFNAMDTDNEEVCIAGSQDNDVVVQILLNDSSVKSKGKSKGKKKRLGATA